MKVVEVAVGVIQQGNEIFISKRDDAVHQGGKWEFPGGKREEGESMAQALARELREEIGIEVTEQQEFMLIEHDYGDKKVRLDIRLVTAFSGEPVGREGQLARWVAIDDLKAYTFPDANTPIIKKLVVQSSG